MFVHDARDGVLIRRAVMVTVHSLIEIRLTDCVKSVDPGIYGSANISVYCFTITIRGSDV